MNLAAEQRGGKSDFNDLVWMVAAWRKPAATMAPTRLSARGMSMLDSRFLGPVAQAFGMPQLASMPFDILVYIQEYSADGPFWRAIRVMVFLDIVMNLKPGPPVDVALTKLETWARDQPIQPYMDGSSELGPVIRIHVDVHGIQKIERLPEMPMYSGECYHDRLFLVGEEYEFKSAMGTIKVCLALARPC